MKRLMFAMLYTLLALPLQAAEKTLISIGTGDHNGVYYAIGQNLCQLINRDTAHNIKCNAPSSAGSVANVRALATGQLNMGLAQADAAQQAYRGEGAFTGEANERLRALFALHTEVFSVLTRAEDDLRAVEHLKGKRVNVGAPDSGTRLSFMQLLNAKGWTLSDVALAAELAPVDASAALCGQDLDALVYMVGHPNAAFKEASLTCPTRLLAVDATALVATAPQLYDDEAFIPRGMYQGNPEAIPSFGVSALLLASADLSDDAVYAICKNVFNDFERFKRLHPALQDLEEHDMIEGAARVLPLHTGALRYYRERGWR